MSDFGFLYELTTKTGECIITQSVTGTRVGDMLEHIAKTCAEQEYIHGKVSIKMLQARLDEASIITDPERMESLTTLVTMATEHYAKKPQKLVIETVYPNQSKLVENLKKVLSNPQKLKKLVEIASKEDGQDETLKLPDLSVGDTLLVGKFKNRRAEIKGFSTDDHNQPVADTNHGEQKIFKPRIAKLMPGAAPEKPAEEPIEEKHLIGKRVTINSPNSRDHKNWGTVKHYDGENYHVSMNDDPKANLEFHRSEIVVKRDKPKSKEN